MYNERNKIEDFLHVDDLENKNRKKLVIHSHFSASVKFVF